MNKLNVRAYGNNRMYYFDHFIDKGNYTLSFNDISGWNINLEPISNNPKYICGDSSQHSIIMMLESEFYDTEGKKIFESDIVIIDNEKHTIEFKNGCFFVENIGLLAKVYKNCKVIGNIYEK